MKKDIILSGVGGQGILSIATVIGYAAIDSGLYMKQAEVHGMSQRGGDVQSHLRISSKEIHSDLIPFGGADIILSIEPMESLRYLPYLSEEGWVITNSTPFDNISNYPDINAVKEEIGKIKKHILIDADDIAKNIGSPMSMNMVMVGAASDFLEIDFEKLEKGIRFIFGSKGEEVVNKNIEALNAGKEFSEKFRNK
ncbi:TPA: indolepyruvate oxidoreductase subunit beta [Candidatus Delongbacteria bacterium]|nr:MAG: indolepyruvate oxidoreductase [Candidatus Delongbacteria bacterium GWF2_40_14]HAQ61315.1 indolepyruvate oxidoreductase subunit beta [Candidatus Delongbacteria bacterium]